MTRSRSSKGRLGALPLLVFFALVFGVPALVLVAGAFTAQGRPSLANLTQSLQGGYLTAMIGSVRLSAVVAVLGAVIGTLLAYAVVASRSRLLREAVLTASGVLANFGGVPLAFFWIATLGNSGVVSGLVGLPSGSLYTFWGLVVVYLYFSIPLMVLVMAPALDGLRPQWREAAANNGATAWHYWRFVGLPVLAPAMLGGVVLLFGSSFSAYATANAMVGTVVPLVTLKIASALTGDVLIGYENIAMALSLDMVVVAGLVMAIYLPLQRRTSRWLH
ncbi:ABC transporter permease [Nonomuraea gerenzanensis]|uniref:Binding-protein-dependent transport systems inner membrane component n=1 Tax=Nonomuraea gerenzanensis TaxID=93944 RepID=A0A1M4ELK7_9ACTN|nr:ABC transporter permease subunit [Nonomuraea gerenzanensis]UBU11251.1 ABC transporter permease subunit [Nonomuraea gerenzanensis]SBO99725.1 binding-protein-dependent transport systems inner membrane component [Nonomuraea gerenzanensis]